MYVDVSESIAVIVVIVDVVVKCDSGLLIVLLYKFVPANALLCASS